MTIEEAIKKAIEAGYQARQKVGKVYEVIGGRGRTERFGRHWEEDKAYAQLLLDPLFWRSLGKAMGCTKKVWICALCAYRKEYYSHHDHTFCPRDGKKLILQDEDKGDWLLIWRSFIDSLAVGQTAEEFFDSLEQAARNLN